LVRKLGVAAVVALLLLCACKGGEEGEETMGIKTQPEIMAVSLSSMGPYQQAGSAFETLFTYMGQTGAEVTGPPMGIYYDDPATVPPESLKYEVLAPVGAEIEVDSPYVFKVIPAHQVAYTVYKGSYENLQKTYEALMTYIEEGGYHIVGPASEIYLTEHGKAPEDEQLTEIRFPVEKK
jgi:effector-binding domain-containing protein